ncbi:MAG TPA: bifunctional phosphoribosylaminoimidazolecarboxamide formyltransferase/IMP cyclohydrolase, partial [Rhizomicrobium sp.]|nr:bifunctional phosphoribosylaminoimidazolecarboxamide formyltransferase/IMP cyclohydrolase [Rhizomicrobium sp.]
MTIRKIARALLSVSDKTGLIEFAKGLSDQGVMLISTGGTAKALRDAGLSVTDVSEVTNFPEMMDGRVKTLHPMVHGGLLSLRDKPDHAAAMMEHGIAGIDLLVCNLYPFEATVARGADFETTIENIDIGGPAMTRSAAKNHDWVTVVVDVEDYKAVLDEMKANGGATTYALRKKLAQRAFARTAAYDAAVSNWFAGELAKEGEKEPPRRRALGGLLRQGLRYGENPHQEAAFYVDGSARPGVASAKQLQGKELSYNNINDTDAAYELVAEFDPKVSAACAIIKHANPCGVALGASLGEAYKKALMCDPVSAFGGILAFNRTLDGATAEEISKLFTEVIIAPDADADARRILSAKKNLRLLIAGGLPDTKSVGMNFKTVAGGFLVQSRDNGHIGRADLKIVSKRQPTEKEIADMLFAFTVGKHVKSNTIVYAKDGQTAGIGAGQMSRVDAARIAAIKAREAQAAAG